MTRHQPAIPRKRLATAIALLLVPHFASAEENSTSMQEAKAEKIVVTAQKRSQSVMEVPLALDAISAEDMKETGSVLLGDIADYTPGFSFSKNDVVQTQATMRGVSTSIISTGGDPSVAIFFDDFYLPRAAQSVMFADLERIEILKGPQGTLFGKNAAAGVVSIYPKGPADEFEGFFHARVGDYNLRRVEGMVNVPVSEDLAVRVNLMSNTRDSYIDNVYSDYNGEELGNRNHQAARISAGWDLSSDTYLQLAYDWDKVDQGYAAQIGVSEYAYSFDAGSRTMSSDVDDGHEARDMSAISVKLYHDFNDQWSGKFVNMYRQWEASGRDDTDGTSDNSRYVDSINEEDSDIFYSELQLNYADDKLSFVSGMTYSKENVYQNTRVNVSGEAVARLSGDTISGELVSALQYYGYDDATIAALGLPSEHIWNPSDWASILSVMAMVDPSAAELFSALGVEPFSNELVSSIVLSGDLTYNAIGAALGESSVLGPSHASSLWGEDITNRGDFTSYGWYADVDYQLDKHWGIAAGLRYSHDEKTFSWEITERPIDGISLPTLTGYLFPVMDELVANNSWKKVTGRLVTRYQIDPSALLYLSYSTGYKSGGFDSLDPTTATDPIEPEEISNIELGYKADLFDDILRVQANLYSMDITNRQQSVNSKLPGSEALIPLVINGDQTVRGVELVLDWYVTEDIKAGLVTEYRKTDSEWEEFYNSEGELTTDSNQKNGATSYTITFDYWPQASFWDGYFKLHADFIYEENIAMEDIDLLPVAYNIPGYFNDKKDLNARISWTSDNEQWELAFWAKNILDNTHFEEVGGLAAEIFGTPATRVSDPRTLGIDVRYQF